MNLKIIILILIFIICSCNNGSESIKTEYFTYDSFKEKFELKHKSLLSPKGLFQPFRIEKIDSFLIILNGDQYSKYAIDLFKLPRLEHYKSLLARGKGPHETLGAWCLDKSDNKFWIFDVVLKKIFAFDMNFITLDNTLPQKEINPPSSESVLYGVNLNDDIFVGTGIFSQNNPLVVFTEDSIINFIGTHPFLKLKNIDNTALHIANESFIDCSPKKDKIITVHRSADRVDVYGIPGNNLISLIGPGKEEPKYTYLTGQAIKKPESIIAYISVKWTDKYIYLLYNGCKWETIYNEGKLVAKSPPGGTTIFVFNSLFVPVYQLNLDKPIWDFTVDEESRIVYAVDASPVSEYEFLITYNLPF